MTALLLEMGPDSKKTKLRPNRSHCLKIFLYCLTGKTYVYVEGKTTVSVPKFHKPKPVSKQKQHVHFTYLNGNEQMLEGASTLLA